MSSCQVFPNARELVARLERNRMMILYGADGTCILAACLVAFLLRFEFSIPTFYRPLLIAAVFVSVVVKLAVFTGFGLHCRSWRYFSVHDLVSLALANVVGAVIVFAVLVAVKGSFPLSVWMMDLFLCLPATMAIRLAARLLTITGARSSAALCKRTFIYGAGSAGLSLLREIRQNPALHYRVCGFIDDAPDKQGLAIQGIRVLGNGEALARLTARHAIDLVLIAVPSASGFQMTRILQRCHSTGAVFKTVPGLAEIIQQSGLAPHLRDVAVEDLLGRSIVQLEEGRISAKFRSRVVLVTGAAGSIGSELCRQIARFQPAAIVGFEIAETPLFNIEQEMARTFPSVPFYPAIGSVQNSHHLAEVFDKYAPFAVFHAAAYKHVPLMEGNAFHAIENNVLGALNVALAAKRCGVQDFIMVSSDKAVRPASVMGASKRLAELVLRSLNSTSIRYISVRFGNVLGSSGSVVPTFKRQIADGGPVTITHPDMRRYFMTIPEACQLVLQSSAMGKGGEIFILNMGEPVRIVDLARNLILLSGLRPDIDIPLEFTGIRPGEKLYEELSALDENTVPTYHAGIRIFAGTMIPWSAMEAYIRRIENVCASRNLSQLVVLLRELIPDYNPSTELLDSVLSVRAVNAR